MWDFDNPDNKCRSFTDKTFLLPAVTSALSSCNWSDKLMFSVAIVVFDMLWLSLLRCNGTTVLCPRQTSRVVALFPALNDVAKKQNIDNKKRQ